MMRQARTTWLGEMAWLGAIAFCNALGSVIVFPLAPFIADGLSVPAQDVALTSLCFNGAAGLGGLASAFFFGRLGSRRALLATLTGLAVTTGLSAISPDFATLLLTRVLAGLCAGPLLAVVFTQAAERAPMEGRNRASGAIVGSYGLALMLGSPMALALVAAAGSWRAPFAAMAVMCVVLALRVALSGGNGQREPARPATEPLNAQIVAAALMRPGSVTGLLLTAGASFATLLISPHLSAFALNNLGASPAELGLVYVIGGGLALLTTGSTGWAMDRLSPRIASLAVGAVLTVLLVYAFVLPVLLPFTIPVLGLVLAAQLARSTIAQASATRVPQARERITYQCLVSAVTSLAQAAGAGISALLLSERPDGQLIGIEWPALISVLICWLSLWLVVRLERQISATASIIDAPRT